MARRLRHRIERTRNKHSRAVFQNETIVIRLARNLSRMEEQEHIENLLRRMMKQVLEEEQKILIHPFAHLLNGGQSQTITLASGRKVFFSLIPGERTRAMRTQNGWTVSVGPRLRRAALHRFLWSLLARSEERRIARLVQSINESSFALPLRSVKLRFASAQWGSCSPRGVIMINAALLFVPPSALRYIIMHELAHRRRADHSPAFWREVAWAMPRYERAPRLLQEYRLPTL